MSKSYEVVADGWEIKGGVVQAFELYGTLVEPFGEASLRRVFEVELPGGMVTLAKCKELVGWLREEHEYEPARVEIELAPHKKAKYYVKQNRLTIRERGDLVYENWDGVISRDTAALADSR